MQTWCSLWWITDLKQVSSLVIEFHTVYHNEYGSVVCKLFSCDKMSNIVWSFRAAGPTKWYNNDSIF